MFPSFTGNSRPKRQVNLSGRNANPFTATPGSRQPQPSQIGQNALAHAQQERVLRQQERQRPPAATKIQSAWRGFRCREQLRNRRRDEWDMRELADSGKSTEGREAILALLHTNSECPPYESGEACLSQLRLLLQYVSPKSYIDILRLNLFVTRYLINLQLLPSLCGADLWIYPLLHLAKIVLAIFRQIRAVSLPHNTVDRLLFLLTALCGIIPDQLSSHSKSYYQALVQVSACLNHRDTPQVIAREHLEGTITGLLKPLSTKTIEVYRGFLSEFLVTPNLSTLDGSLVRIANNVNYKFLISALNELLVSPKNDLFHLKSHDELLWLLAYFLYFHRVAFGLGQGSLNAPEAQYIDVVAKFLSYLGDDIPSRLDVSGDLPSADEGEFATSKGSALPLPTFVHNEILALVNQESVSSLFAHLDVSPATEDEPSEVSNQTSTLASFALTLLRCFPRKVDDIRMWLYLGSTSKYSEEGNEGTRLPAIKYLYQAIRKTRVLIMISKDPRQTISLISPNRAKARSRSAVIEATVESIDQQWRVILLFFELYTFILKVMDDEEFLSGSSPPGDSRSWTRQSALPLEQIRELTIFLKHLAFAMYWYASEIRGIEVPKTENSIAQYFGGNINAFSETRQDGHSNKADEIAVAGVSRMTLVYVKGMVTGLLRMIYERE
jgi:ubiquitin-protein ligase E3 C